MKDVMLDFETFGNGANACVVQVGACYFDRDTGQIGHTFKSNIDANSCVRQGGQIDASTVYWWLKQSDTVRDGLDLDTHENNDFVKVLFQLNDFLKGAENIWSHATFDFVILQTHLKKIGIIPSFSYRAARDIRTLLDIAGDTGAHARVGLHHDALDDCKTQVQYCVKALQVLKK